MFVTEVSLKILVSVHVRLLTTFCYQNKIIMIIIII